MRLMVLKFWQSCKLSILASVIMSGRSPVLQILLQIFVKISVMVFSSARTSSAGILSTSAGGLTLLKGCYCNLNFLIKARL